MQQTFSIKLRNGKVMTLTRQEVEKEIDECKDSLAFFEAEFKRFAKENKDTKDVVENIAFLRVHIFNLEKMLSESGCVN